MVVVLLKFLEIMWKCRIRVHSFQNSIVNGKQLAIARNQTYLVKPQKLDYGLKLT